MAILNNLDLSFGNILNMQDCGNCIYKSARKNFPIYLKLQDDQMMSLEEHIQNSANIINRFRRKRHLKTVKFRQNWQFKK